MSKPALIHTLEQRFSLAFVSEETTDPAVFSRYGRKEVDACRYWLREGEIVGLCARASGINSLDWLSSPALQKLEVLLLGENTFTDISIPASWTSFQRLDLNASPELTSLVFEGTASNLSRLEMTNCPALVDLDMPENCPNLHYFDLSRSNLKHLDLAGDFSSLVYLDASHNPSLKRVSLAGNFASLLSLHLRAGALEKLSLTANFPVLDTLDLAYNASPKLELPQGLILKETLLRLYAKGCTPKNCRSHFLKGDNAIEKARTWFRELAVGNTEHNKRIKLLFTGNGNVGKSTLLCALRGEKGWRCSCSTDHDSTHGIQIGIFEKEGVVFSFWDFGGQDVYGATHQLFYADEAVQLIVYDTTTEALAESGQAGDDRAGGQEIKHQLPYFYSLLSERSGQDGFLFVQNKAFRPEESCMQEVHPDIQAFAKEVLPQQPPILVDAKEGLGVESLMQRVLPLARTLPHYDMEFPATWLEVRKWFIANENRQEENGQPVDRKRRITKKFFADQICQPRGVKDPDAQEALLEDLAAAGYCYYRPNDEVLGQEVIVDQGWALEAIYRPLHREKVADTWRRFEGRVLVSEIYEVLGPEYDTEDKALLLRFMMANGLCFPSSQLEETEAAEKPDHLTYYVFPTYLPGGKPEALELLQERSDILHLRARVPFLNRTKFQHFLCELGRKVDSFDHLSRLGIFLKTEDGCLGAWMNYADKCYEVFCEPQAAGNWLKSLLEECPGDDWEILTKEGFQPLDTEEHSRQPGDREGKNLKTDLKDGMSELPEAPLDRRQALAAFQEQLENLVDEKNFENFFSQLKLQLIKGGKRYILGRSLFVQFSDLDERITNRTIRAEERQVLQNQLVESCLHLVYRLEVEDWKGA